MPQKCHLPRHKHVKGTLSGEHAHVRRENWHPKSGGLFVLHCYQCVRIAVCLHACVNSPEPS